MRPFLALAASAAMLLSLAPVGAQCPGGTCPTQPSWSAQPQYSQPQYSQPQYSQPQYAAPSQAAPLPQRNAAAVRNFRYVASTEYPATVQIVTVDRDRSRSQGSGVLVRWGGRLLVITARHVVKDAKSIVVRLLSKQNRQASVVVADPTWDCAILDIGQDDPGVEPAKVSTEDLKVGDTLTTVGFGPDSRMAANTGRMVAFRAASGGDAADWCEISGPARGGDSGGPVYTTSGEVAGVLWGTDGRVVEAVQIGRVGLCLNAALKRLGPLKAPDVQVAVGANSSSVSVGCGILRRQPTPAPSINVAPPNVVVEADPNVGRSLQGIEGSVGRIEQNTAPQAGADADTSEGLQPWLIAVLIGGGLVVGLVLFYAVGKN